VSYKSANGVVIDEKVISGEITNTSSGYLVGKRNYIGKYNTGVGTSVLSQNITGSYNVGLGYQALSNIQGIYNVGVGTNTLASATQTSACTAIGHGSLSAQTISTGNTSIGTNTLSGITTGGNNTAMGINAGRSTGSGSNVTISGGCLYLGGYTKSLSDNVLYETVIGYNITGAGANTCTIGASSFPTANVMTSATAPTVTGFGTGASVPYNNGTTAFTINVGTSNSGSTGTINLPTAAHGWVCHVSTNVSTNSVSQTGGTAATVVLSNFARTTGLASNWTDGDVLSCICFAY